MTNEEKPIKYLDPETEKFLIALKLHASHPPEPSKGETFTKDFIYCMITTTGCLAAFIAFMFFLAWFFGGFNAQ